MEDRYREYLHQASSNRKENKKLLQRWGKNPPKNLDQQFHTEHDKAFEDRVWTCLAKMGFEEMNGTSSLKLVYLASTSVPGRKLDVYAADKETVIIVECKSAEELKRKNLQTIIND